MKNILVTGGNGFIGSHLVNELTKQGNHVTIFDLYPRLYDDLPSDVLFIQGNLSDFGLIRRTLEDRDIQIVYHTAWGNIAETSLENVFQDIEMNLQPTINLLEACRNSKVQKFIYLSSGGTVYGIPTSIPVREDHATNPINPYGITKLAVEKYVQMYSHLYGLDYIILRPSVPYGPRQNPHRRQGVISVFIYNALRGFPVTIWGDGNQIIRDYFYISDLINALISAKDYSDEVNRIFNLGGIVEYSLNDIIPIIQSTLGMTLEVKYESDRPFDIKRLHLDISKARQFLKWEPVVPIQQGITWTAEWIEKYIKS